MATQIEKEGFSGIYCQSVGDCIGLCEALAFATNEIPFGTSIANMYTRHPYDFAQTAALIHEVSGGRFRFGVGVSHGPMLNRLKVKAGKPLADMRQFVSDLHASVGRKDALPPLSWPLYVKPWSNCRLRFSGCGMGQCGPVAYGHVSELSASGENAGRRVFCR